MANSVWVSVNGNGAVREGSQAPSPSGGHPGGMAYGWGREFPLGTNANDTPQNDFNRAAVFHFSLPTPFALSTVSAEHNVETDTDQIRARLLAVAVQANLVNSRLVWIDVWDRSNRLFTTSPGDATGTRPFTQGVELSGDLTNAWDAADWNTTGFDRARDNVIRFLPDDQPTIFGAVGISLAVMPLGSAAEGGQNAGQGGVVTFTHVAAHFGFTEMQPLPPPPSVITDETKDTKG